MAAPTEDRFPQTNVDLKESAMDWVLRLGCSNTIHPGIQGIPRSGERSSPPAASQTQGNCSWSSSLDEQLFSWNYGGSHACMNLHATNMTATLCMYVAIIIIIIIFFRQ